MNEQRTAVYDDLHKEREGGRARVDRKAPIQTSTATPRIMMSMPFYVALIHFSTRSENENTISSSKLAARIENSKGLFTNQSAVSVSSQSDL